MSELKDLFRRMFDESTPTTERDGVFLLIVNHSRSCRGLPPVEVDEAIRLGRMWDVILAKIPTDRLEASYLAAMRRYTDARVPFGTAQILEAWNELDAEIE